MAYTGQPSSGLRMDMSQLDPLTERDVQARQDKLVKMGLGDSWLGQANQWSGQMVKQRDELKSQVSSSLLDMLGGKEALASSAIQSVAPAAAGGLATSGAASGAVGAAATGGSALGLLGAAM